MSEQPQMPDDARGFEIPASTHIVAQCHLVWVAMDALHHERTDELSALAHGPHGDALVVALIRLLEGLLASDVASAGDPASAFARLHEAVTEMAAATAMDALLAGYLD